MVETSIQQRQEEREIHIQGTETALKTLTQVLSATGPGKMSIEQGRARVFLLKKQHDVNCRVFET